MAEAVMVVGFAGDLWLAQRHFSTPAEAWHFHVANQDSMIAALKGELAPSLILSSWCSFFISGGLGTSGRMLRLPARRGISVSAG